LITVWAVEQNIKNTWIHLYPNQDFELNDYSIPWVDSNKKDIYYRYYHLFSKSEVECIVNYLENEHSVTVGHSITVNYSLNSNNWVLNVIKTKL
jgi:hypothetical protein